MQSLIDSTAQLANTVVLRGNGTLIIGAYTVIEDYVVLDTGEDPSNQLTIGPRCKVKSHATLKTCDGNLTIGSRTTIGEYCLFNAHGGLVIGNDCIFGPYVLLNAATHIIEGSERLRYQGETMFGITIHDNVMIGSHCSLFDRVTVGVNVIIGSHSLVLSDIPSNCIAYGQPAKVKRANLNHRMEKQLNEPESELPEC